MLCRVKASTFFAVTVLVYFPTDATTVTAVPSATAIVVAVVAVAIFDVKLCSTRFRSLAFRSRRQALSEDNDVKNDSSKGIQLGHEGKCKQIIISSCLFSSRRVF